MKTLVTGSTGFIGRHLIKALRQQGRIVRCLVRKTSKSDTLMEFGVELTYGDLHDPDSLQNALKGVDVVYHAAGEVFVSQPDQYYTTNVSGLKNLLAACSKASVKKFIHFSSSSATGPNPLRNVPVTEATPCNPITPYGRSKLEGEKVINEFLRENRMPVVIIRPPLVYGPGLSKSSRVLMFLNLIHKGLFRIIGDGNNLISLCYIDNLIQGVLLAESVQQAEGQIYFLADKRPYTTIEIAEAIAREQSKPIPNAHIPIWAATVLSTTLAIPAAIWGFTSPLTRNTVKELKNSWYVDITKAQKDLGFQPSVDFKDGVKKTAAWFLNEYLPAQS